MVKICYCIKGILLSFCIGSYAYAQEFDLGPIPEVSIECLATSKDAGKFPQDPLADGSWLQVRRDRKLTGRSPLIGYITCPRVLWRYDTAQTRKTFFSVNPGDDNSQTALPTAGSGYIGDIEMDFETMGYQVDLDNDGLQLISPLDSDDRIDDFLPALTGFERISCHPENIGLNPDDEELVPCYLQNRSNGDWVDSPVWISDPVSGMGVGINGANGAPIVADIDFDGELEVAVKGWYDITVLNLNTGVVENVGQFKDPNGPGAASGRAYGWWGAINVDNDPKLEIVLLGDLEQFISVIGWVDGELKEIWDYEIEAGVDSPAAKHDTGVAPVGDVDGDGMPEIVTSIYNKTGDQRWHVMGFDGISGAIEIDLVDRYLTGLEDLDGDGIAELFVTATTNSVLPEYGDISVLSYNGGEESVIWSKQNRVFVTADIPRFPDNVFGQNKHGRLSLFYRSGWANGRPVFLTKEDASNGVDVIFRMLQFDQEQVTEIASLSGPRLSLKSLSSTAPQNGILFRAYTQDPAEGPVSLTKLSGNVEQYGRVDATDGVGVPGARAGLLGGTVVGKLSVGATPTLVTQGFGEQMIAMRIDDGLTPTELWRRPGRGMVTLTDESVPYESVLLADVSGTGDLAVISARKGTDGLGEISALDSQGKELWSESFNVPGDLPPFNEGGVTNWTAGHFRSNQYEDIVAHIRISSEGSNALHLLNGQTGVTEWTLSVGATCDGVDVTGAGGMHMPVFDWDADGLDEMLNYAAGIAVYNGEQPEILLEKITNPYCPPYVFAEPFSARATGVVADFLGDGAEQFLFAANHATLGVLDFNLTVLWNTPFFDGLNSISIQGVGDLDGTGGLEIVSVGHDDPSKEIHVFNAATGVERWTLAMPGLCDIKEFSHVATGDIDGDGRDEALFIDCNILYAIGENKNGLGEILWRATFQGNRYNADLGEVVIADVDGTGRPQILLNTASGYLYGLGSVQLPPSEFIFNSGFE